MEKDILLMLDLPIWNLALSEFSFELDCVILIDSGLGASLS